VKILVSSYLFSPSVGGIETVSALLAPEFVKAGHEVILVTRTAAEDGVPRPYEVVRRPAPGKLVELVRWCDVYFQNNISLILAWPLLFVRKPWVIAHHTWLREYGLHPNLKGQLKRLLLRFGTNATISRPVAADISVPSTIVGNPYSKKMFKLRPEIARDREVAYLGRLVPDKGVDMLIQSVAELRASGLDPRLTIIGSGSEEEALRRLVAKLHLEDRVEFTGTKGPEDIACLLNAHQVLAVPSRWAEPFGIVALEGIASGCIIAASDSGGLPEAMGPCGLLFPAGDQAALTATLRTLLTQPGLREKLHCHFEEHLQKFDPATVAGKYLAIFERARAERGGTEPCR
jgi:glycosyltransferase involved in cell wall biosynthesis